ncbi:MAG TPA: PaaI family thioesterase [Syntrophales bacterium]|nr:PaaI family thioesterase [Geobacteraceae bacterium]HPQ45448.1 PaaI family thioesterase [Syntrophales bacterium]
MEEYEELDPEFKSILIDTMKNRSPYWALLGMEIVDVKKGWAKVRLPFKNELLQPLGVVHGGAIFSPADSAVAMALIGLVERDEFFSTMEMKINYLIPFREGEITAEARIIYKGSKTALGDVEIRNADDDLIAKGLSTYMIMKSRNNNVYHDHR